MKNELIIINWGNIVQIIEFTFTCSTIPHTKTNLWRMILISRISIIKHNNSITSSLQRRSKQRSSYVPFIIFNSNLTYENWNVPIIRLSESRSIHFPRIKINTYFFLFGISCSIIVMIKKYQFEFSWLKLVLHIWGIVRFKNFTFTKCCATIRDFCGNLFKTTLRNINIRLTII